MIKTGRKFVTTDWHPGVKYKYVIECIGESHDPRGLKLWRLEDGRLYWLPDWAIKDEKRRDEV